MQNHLKGDFLLLTSLIPDKEFNKLLLLDKNPQMATHLFYWKFFKGIKTSRLKESNFYVISTRPIAEFPTCKIRFVKSKTWKTDYGDLHEIFFVNYPVIRIFTVFISCILQGIKWGVSTKNRNKRAIIADSTVPYLLTGYILSRLYKIPLIGIMTDPPNMHYKISWESSFKTKFRKLNGQIINFLFKKLSAVIALTKGLVDKYCSGKENLIIEGIIDSIETDDGQNISNTDKFVLLYSGSLSRVYGILELIKAFMRLPFNDIELWIFGKGDIENKIAEFAKKDNRLKYFGFLENSKVKHYQKIASLLVNPRPINLPDANYSFPSKILEYMQSGTPTLLTRLPGIPKEYDQYVFYTKGSEEHSFEEKIREIYFIERGELRSFGQKAKNFAESKSITHQGNKIGNFIIEVTKKFKKI
jgi:glycosyltransferase involved in cell wall biosynthesis